MSYCKRISLYNGMKREFKATLDFSVKKQLRLFNMEITGQRSSQRWSSIHLECATEYRKSKNATLRSTNRGKQANSRPNELSDLLMATYQGSGCPLILGPMLFFES